MSRWIILGDSIMTTAYGADATKLTSTLIQNTGVYIHNFSAGGQRMGRLGNQEYVPVTAVDQKSGLMYIRGFEGVSGVIITLGYNDFAAGGANIVERFKKAYQELVNYLNQVDFGQLVLVSPIRTRNGTESQILDDIRNAVLEVAEEYGAIHIQGKEIIPDDDQYYDQDGLHLNENGHQVFSQYLIENINF